MTGLQIIVLAIVQGLTEFLPISSSGHLVLVPYLVEWTDQGLAFDVAVHFGSLIAVPVVDVGNGSDNLGRRADFRGFGGRRASAFEVA